MLGLGLRVDISGECPLVRAADRMIKRKRWKEEAIKQTELYHEELLLKIKMHPELFDDFEVDKGDLSVVGDGCKKGRSKNFNLDHGIFAKKL